MTCHEHPLPWEDSLWFTGASLNQGMQPALFYFSLSGEQSLTLAPYNQPVTELQGAPLRIFSLTLPFHGPDLDPTKAFGHMAEAMARGENPIGEFLDRAQRTIAYLVDQGVADPDHMASAGLSRGALIATHLAARDPRIGTVCGFAPWMEPARSPEFHELADRMAVQQLALTTLIDQLTCTAIRFYVGNRDTAVSTERVFRFITDLTERAYQQRIRSPHAELIITPSIGHRGHGTPESSFNAGAAWLKQRLLDD